MKTLALAVKTQTDEGKVTTVVEGGGIIEGDAVVLAIGQCRAECHRMKKLSMIVAAYHT